MTSNRRETPLSPEVAEALATLRLAEEVRGYTSHTYAEWRAIDQAPEALALITRELERGARVYDFLANVTWHEDIKGDSALRAEDFERLRKLMLTPQEEERP